MSYDVCAIEKTEAVVMVPCAQVRPAAHGTYITCQRSRCSDNIVYSPVGNIGDIRCFEE